MTKLSDYIMDFVVRQGVRHVFMLTGGGAMHLNDSVGREKRLEYVCNLHEQACAIAADAYAQYTSNLGVAVVTTGPGGTNTLTGVAAAWLESTPCLILSGQVKRADMVGDRGVRQMGFQEIGITKLVASITKYAVTVTEPESIRYHLEKAVHLARAGRPGPVWVDVPLDVQAAEIDETALGGFEAPVEMPGTDSKEALRSKTAEIIELLNQAERPVILAGNGIRLAGGRDEFISLAELLGIPVLLTWKTADFLPDDHPLFAGRPGLVGQRGANFAQQNSDLVIAVGARLDLGQLAYSQENFARGAHKVIVDVDAAELAKMRIPIDIAVCTDARSFLMEMRAQANLPEQDRWSGWSARIRQWRERYPICLPDYWDETGAVSQYVLVEVLSDEMTGDDVLALASSGAANEVTCQAFRIKAGQRFFSSHGLGSMGFGIPAALGSCVASGCRTISIEGDGGFHMNIQELETVHRLGLPIKFFVLDNAGYGSIRSTQRNYFEGRYVGSSAESGLTLPDTLKVAEAYGIATAEILDHSHVREQVQRVLAQPGPVVCNVKMSPAQATIPRVTSRRLPDGRMVSSPMEDMFPFLDRGEFAANMLIPHVDEEG